MNSALEIDRQINPIHNIKLLYLFVLFYNNWFRFWLHTHTFISQSDRQINPIHNIKLLYLFVLFYNNWFRFWLHAYTFISQSDRENKQVYSLVFFLHLYLNL